MSDGHDIWDFARHLDGADVLQIAAVLMGSRVLQSAIPWAMRRAAEREPRFRLAILRLVPLARLTIRIGAMLLVVSMVVDPTLRNVVALLAASGLALAFAFKDYGSSLVAGLVTVLEAPYQPGDWIEVDGAYGEVKSIDLRAVHVVTADDTEVIIPHSRLWSASIFNATSGSRSLLCVTDFFLHPDHDASIVRRALSATAESSGYRRPETPVVVIVKERPWGTHYRLKAYVREAREQFLFMTDLTIRGKDALRGLNMQFAQAPYAETGKAGN